MTTTPLGSSIIASPELSVAGPRNSASSRATATGWFTPAMLSVAALSLGLAIQVNFGQYHPAAMPWLTASLAACVLAVVVPNFGRLSIANWRPDQLIIAVGLSVQFAMLYVTDPAATLKVDTADDLAPFKAGVAMAAALVAVGVTGTRVARVAVPLVLLTYLLLGVWLIRSTPAPGVDVYVFQHDASQALINGNNPYAITFPDIYRGKLPVYGEGLVKDGRLTFGYPYPPLSLLLALPGHLLGDFRYAQLLAMTLAGAFIAYARPTNDPVPTARTVAAAAMLLFTPRGFFVLEAGWTEPFAVLMLAATVFTACRHGKRWAFVCAAAFGLLLATKQYMILALPLALLLPAMKLPGRRFGVLVVSLIVAAVVTLPLALWDVKAFIHSAVTLQFHQPFRWDSLSYLVPLGTRWGIVTPAWTSFACAGIAGLLALWRSPRTPAGFAVAIALVMFAFFATSKQAFCNYYVLVLGAMCCALAATPGVPRTKPVRV